MTELFIDNKPVMLPAGLDLKVKQQNPLITKNGTFTLDLTLSLQERNNSILYRHIERLQTAAAFNNRKALLISNGHIIINGTEAYISNTNEEVKIQLLSGNSELNYFIGSDAYISSLDLGKETDLSNEHFNIAIKSYFPYVNFACPMVKIGNVIYNKCYNKKEDFSLFPVYEFSNRAIQPYLLAMIEKILTAMEYLITENEAANDKFLSRIFILNKDVSGDYNKILPGWTVKEFLEECEKLMNIIFVIDNTNRNVRILCADSHKETGTYTINNVLDSFERTTVDDNLRVSYNNVCYDFPNSTEYKYQTIEDDQMNAANIIEVKSYSELLDKFTDSDGVFLGDELIEEQLKRLNIWHVKDTDNYYIPERSKTRIDNLPGDLPGDFDTKAYLLKVNTYKSYISDKDKDYLKLSFFPCVFTRLAYALRSGSVQFTIYTAIPYLPGADDSDDDPEAKTIKQLIENGLNDFNKSKAKVALCAVTPATALNKDYTTFTDYTQTHGFMKRDLPVLDIGSFRLDGKGGMVQHYYKTNQNIDTSKEYTIKFITNTMPDIQAQFILANKLFICKELEYRIMNEGIHPEVTGTFYAVVN